MLWYREKTRAALREILQKYPAWEKYVEIKSADGKTLSLQEIRNVFSQNPHEKIPFGIDDNAYGALCLTAICREYAVRLDATNKFRSHTFIITSVPPDDKVLNFPYGMFFPPTEENAPLCAIRQQFIVPFLPFFAPYFTPCNEKHRFSQWLIQNQTELLENVTGLYNDILKNMLMCTERDSLIADINAILTQLRGYRNNYFGVTDELFLTDADIVEIKEEEED